MLHFVLCVDCQFNYFSLIIHSFKKYNQINVREYGRTNQKWTFQRNWQHKIHKTKKNKTKTQHNIVLDTGHYNKQTQIR